MLQKILKRKFGDYVIEFCIVLLGITIAFWLSNLGEKAKERRLEKVYLQQLNEDITEDINVMMKAISFNNIKITSLNTGVNYIYKNSKSLSTDSVEKYTLQCGNYNFFYPTSNSYVTLQQSGDLKIIRDQELKKKLIVLYQSYEIIKTEQLNIVQALDDNLYPLLYESYDMITEEITDSEFFKSTKCTNFVAFTLDSTSQMNDLYKYSKRLAEATSDWIINDLGELDATQDNPD